MLGCYSTENAVYVLSGGTQSFNSPYCSYSFLDAKILYTAFGGITCCVAANHANHSSELLTMSIFYTSLILL